MKKYSDLIKSLENDDNLHDLTRIELTNLHIALLSAFDHIFEICQKHRISLMLVGGTALGAVRHRGFIPWDDDLDVAMTRRDFMEFKKIFNEELGDRFILCAPNFNDTAKTRFPQILIKNTSCVCLGGKENDKIKIDLFIIENIPRNVFIRLTRGVICSALMFIASQVHKNKDTNELYKAYLYKSKEGRRYYRRMKIVGSFFSFLSDQRWFNLVDNISNYKKKTEYMGIPAGRKHYFGEIFKTETFVPCADGVFEGRNVLLPNNVDAYLSNLYGNYMEIPPENEREKHYILSIRFNDETE